MYLWYIEKKPPEKVVFVSIEQFCLQFIFIGNILATKTLNVLFYSQFFAVITKTIIGVAFDFPVYIRVQVNQKTMVGF